MDGRILAFAIGLTFTGWGCGSTSTADDCQTSRQAGQACCEDLGIDACDLGLFCAAFADAQAKCYADGSRKDGNECQANNNCKSFSCDPVEQRCQAMPNSACELALGCSDALDGRQACDPTTSRCVPTDGALGSPCERPEDCVSQTCADNICISANAACRTECEGCATPVPAACAACLEAELEKGTASACITEALKGCPTASTCGSYVHCRTVNDMTAESCGAATPVGQAQFVAAASTPCGGCVPTP